MSTSLSIQEVIKLKFDEVQNIMIEREKNMKMEMAKVVRERDSLKKEVDLLEKTQSLTNLEKCSLEQKLCSLERRCEELDKRIVEMEEKIQKLRREKLDVEKKLRRSERKCEELKVDANRSMEEMKRKNEELRVKKMESDKAAEVYKSRIDYLESRMLKLKKLAKVLNLNLTDLDTSAEEEEEEEEGGSLSDFVESAGDEDAMSPQVPSRGIGLSKKGGGRKEDGGSNIPASHSGVAETKGASYSVSFNRRCDLGIINKIKKNLHKKNLEIFEQSCFGHLVKIDNLKFQGQLMLQLLWHVDMGASNEEMLVFNINNSNMEFGASDFSLITGLHVGTSEAHATKTSSSIHKDVFQGSPSLMLTDVEGAFLTASRDNEGRGELTLKLALLYFLYGILLPRNKRVNKSDMKYLHLVEDLEKFNAFPWGRVAYEFLVKSILSVRGRMDGSEANIKKFDIHGFSYALQAWAYEVMPSVATYCANNLGNLTPRILRWSATKQFRFNDLNKLFTPGDKPHSNILMEREKSMRIELDELRLEKMKSDKAAQHYKKRLEDLEPAVVVQDNKGKEPEIRGSHARVTRSDGVVPTGKMARPSSAAGDVIITISDSDDDFPDRPSWLTNKRNITDCFGEDWKKRSKPTPPSPAAESLLQKFNAANDVNLSDDESFSDFT